MMWKASEHEPLFQYPRIPPDFLMNVASSTNPNL
jgi:hypothetical protein